MGERDINAVRYNSNTTLKFNPSEELVDGSCSVNISSFPIHDCFLNSNTDIAEISLHNITTNCNEVTPGKEIAKETVKILETSELVAGQTGEQQILDTVSFVGIPKTSAYCLSVKMGNYPLCGNYEDNRLCHYEYKFELTNCTKLKEN